MNRLVACILVYASSAFAAPPQAPRTDAQTGATTFSIWNGKTATVGQDGIGFRADASGLHPSPFAVLRPQGRGGVGGPFGPSDLVLQRQLSLPQRGKFVPGRVIVSIPGAAQAAPSGGATTGITSIDGVLRNVGAKSMRPVAADSDLYVVDVGGDDPMRAARKLRQASGVAWAEPDWIVTSMATEPRPLPFAAPPLSARAQAAASTSSSLPSNFGLQSSLQSWLNANGVNAVAAYSEIQSRFGQLPGQGTIITNVSLGDLTDQAMADAGDSWVQAFGPTTVVVNGQRYLDYPSLPLIPTFVADSSGGIDPLGTVEFVDPYLGEVLLDFSVMAPLPHDRQRPGETGSGATDLLGIAPGAQYRLVVPKEPTISNILAAFLAAARQTPKPDVITASLGPGTDVTGYPGRYLEDDPIAQSVIRKVVKSGVVVAISSNDGTRLFTNAAIGPDGGSAATDLLPQGAQPTSVADDALSTVPSLVADSGAMAIGGTTLDDVFSAPPHAGGPLAALGQFPTTRFNGGGGFSSGFGSRVNLSGPSDNIVALLHACGFFACGPHDVVAVLEGGTSASTPMAAAAAAVVLQVARLTHQRLTPAQVRDLLVRTARPLTQAPQTDPGRPVTVGPQLDVTAAVEALLGAQPAKIVRLSVAHRQALQDLGATFETATDPGAIDLLGPADPFTGLGTGQNVVGPITIAADVTSVPRTDDVRFALTIGNAALLATRPVFRLMPEELLSYAGLPLASNDSRTVSVGFEVRRGTTVLASASTTLVLGPTDGTYSEALAPVAPAVVRPGQGVTVSYDLRGVRHYANPQLVVSSIDHFSPTLAPIFRAETTIALRALSGTVKVPASAFAAGAGIYGIGIVQDPSANWFGEFAIVRVGTDSAPRPDAPALEDGSGSFGHLIAVNRASPGFRVRWDVTSVKGADGALLEISAPGPGIFGSANTFTNHNGDRFDRNGVDSSSTLVKALPGTSGVADLDAVALGIPSSLLYGVRVWATARGAPVGQASPVSALEFDDGLAPGGALVVNFDVSPGAASSVALLSVDANGNLAGSTVAPYAPATATYGAPFASDATGQALYAVFGSDPSLHSAVVARYGFSGSQDLDVFDTRTGALTGSVTVDPNAFFLVNGRVDARHHRAAFLAYQIDPVTFQISDQVLPLDLRSRTLGSPITADVGLQGGGFFNTIDVDASTGRAILASTFGDLCFLSNWPHWLGEVDVGAGTALPVTTGPNCMMNISSDQMGGSAYSAIGPLFSFPRLFPVGQWVSISERSLNAGTVRDLDGRGPIFTAVDNVNGLLVVGYLVGIDYLTNNTAMGAIGVYDVHSGKRISLSESVNLLYAYFGPVLYVGERGIQLDPATRTGWTLGPFGAQIQQFSY